MTPESAKPREGTGRGQCCYSTAGLACPGSSLLCCGCQPRCVHWHPAGPVLPVLANSCVASGCHSCQQERWAEPGLSVSPSPHSLRQRSRQASWAEWQTLLSSEGLLRLLMPSTGPEHTQASYWLPWGWIFLQEVTQSRCKQTPGRPALLVLRLPTPWDKFKSFKSH